MSLLVLVVLLGMWGFVLYPLVRSRHSRVDEIRSVARFSSALRVLSAGSGNPGRSRPPLGMRQLHMPPRVGIEAARAARLTAGRSARFAPALPPVGAAALRRRQIMAGAIGFFLLSLGLLFAAQLVVVQVLADLSLIAAVALCRWSSQQERAQRARQLRRARPARARAATAGYDGVPAAEPLVMTVPLDAPPMPRRAVPTVPAADEPAVPARSAVAVRGPASGAIAAGTAPTRPWVEPLILAEIDIDWEPAIAEPASMVRVVDLARPRRLPVRMFDDGDESVDVGDDAGLDVLIARRSAASGW